MEIEIAVSFSILQKNGGKVKMKDVYAELKAVRAVQLLAAFGGIYAVCWVANTVMRLLGVA